MQIENGEIKIDSGEILLRPGIFKTQNGELHLVGRRCKKCGDISFPPYRFCLNCDSQEENEECILGNKWTLYSFTQAFMVTPAFQPGYILAKVELADSPDVKLTAQLCDCDIVDLKKDMELEMVPRVVQENQQGNKVVSYCFRPLKKS